VDVLEISGGEIRIMEEMTEFQEAMKKWFYTGMLIGTTFFAGFYVALWFFLKALYRYIRRSRYVKGEDHPCDLDVDEDDFEYVDVYPEVDADRQGDPSSVPPPPRDHAGSASHFRNVQDFGDDFDNTDEWEDLYARRESEHEGPAAAEGEDVDGGESDRNNGDDSRTRRRPARTPSEAMETHRRDDVDTSGLGRSPHNVAGEARVSTCRDDGSNSYARNTESRPNGARDMDFRNGDGEDRFFSPPDSRQESLQERFHTVLNPLLQYFRGANT